MYVETKVGGSVEKSVPVGKSSSGFLQRFTKIHAGIKSGRKAGNEVTASFLDDEPLAKLPKLSGIEAVASMPAWIFELCKSPVLKKCYGFLVYFPTSDLVVTIVREALS